MEICDLHTHTTASDGSDSPVELVQKAAQAGLKAVAITDHDTVAGIQEGLEAGGQFNIEVIPGVELSAKSDKGNMHILGYFIDVSANSLQEVLATVQQARAERNPAILSKLVDLGLPVDMEEVKELAGEGQVGRPHIARVMVQKGYVKSVGEAFNKYLKKGGPAYAPKSILEPADAITAIHKGGGVAVLAHPISLEPSGPEELAAIIKKMVDYGIDGIECYYSEYTPQFTELCLSLTQKFALVPTGGSDYHGKAKPYIRLGKGKGDLQVPYSCVKELKGVLSYVQQATADKN